MELHTLSQEGLTGPVCPASARRGGEGGTLSEPWHAKIWAWASARLPKLGENEEEEQKEEGNHVTITLQVFY